MSDEPVEIMEETYDLMLVDPDEETRELYEDLFEEKGARVDKFSTPEEALEEEDSYDAAVIELPSNDPRYSKIIGSIEAEKKIVYTAFDRNDFPELDSEVEFIGKPHYREMFENAIPDDFREWVNPASWLSHDLQNRINAVRGYTDLEGDEEEREAGEKFHKLYQRFERVLYGVGEFDSELLDDMKDEIENIENETALANAKSTIHTTKSVRDLFESNGNQRRVSEIFRPIDSYGEVNHVGEVENQEIKSHYGAIIGTKICDFLKHAKNEDPEAEMFAEISKEEDHIKAYIGDTGPGIEPEDLERPEDREGQEDTGKGTEIIELVTKLDDATFAGYTGEKVEEIEFEGEKPEDIGALFELRIDK